MLRRIAAGAAFFATLVAFTAQAADTASGAVVVVYAATDRRAVEPLIEDFERLNPGLKVDYHDLDSAALYQRFLTESAAGGGADVVWSSAMDLQVKLVNDGHAQHYESAETAALPPWANWKNEAFGTTYEPIGIAYNRELLPDSEVPTTHAELLRLLNGAPGRFRERLATYDPARSGLGFLLHSQDNQANPVMFWSLVQVMGGIGVRSFATTGAMLDQVSSGRCLLAYNVLGSYALTRAETDPALGVGLLRDTTQDMSRVAFIARTAPHPAAARRFLDHLLSRRGQALIARNAGLFAVRSDLPSGSSPVDLRAQLGPAFRPIAIGPGLLTYQDQVKRENFLAHWEGLIVRP
jgi:iron(III) transport system substrate-binding protein